MFTSYLHSRGYRKYRVIVKPKANGSFQQRITVKIYDKPFFSYNHHDNGISGHCPTIIIEVIFNENKDN